MTNGENPNAQCRLFSFRVVEKGGSVRLRSRHKAVFIWA